MNQKKPIINNGHAASRGGIMDRTGALISDLAGKLLRFLRPDPMIWKGAGWGLAILVLVLVFLKAIMLVKSLGVSVSALMILFYVVMAGVAGTGIFFGLKWITTIPDFYRFVLFAALVALANFWEGNDGAMVVLIAYTLLAASFLGGVLAVVMHRKWTLLKTGKKVLNLFTRFQKGIKPC